MAYNHPGQRADWPHVATWAKTETVLAVDLGDGTDDPRATAPDLLCRALAALPQRARPSGRVALRADTRYFAGALTHARHLTLRLPPGHSLLPEVLARLGHLPAPA